MAYESLFQCTAMEMPSKDYQCSTAKSWFMLLDLKSTSSLATPLPLFQKCQDPNPGSLESVQGQKNLAYKLTTEARFTTPDPYSRALLIFTS